MAENPSLTPQEQVIYEKTYKYPSEEHFAFLYVDEEKKNAIRTIYAVFNDIKNILYTQTESNVARLKLSWWKDAIGRLYASEDKYHNHPLSQALLPLIRRYDLKPQFFLNIIESVEMDLTHHRYLDFQSLNRFFTLQNGSMFCLISQVLGPTTPNTIKYAQKLGEAKQYIDTLASMGLDASQGRIYVPMDYLREHGVTANHFLKSTQEATQGTLKEKLIKDATKKLNEAYELLKEMDGSIATQIKSMTALGHMGRAKLKKIKKGDPFKNEIALSALQMLMISSKTWLRM